MADRLDWLLQPFAHRGLHAPERGVVENTKTAFQAAMDAGYGIELDVRLSGNGDVVVFHDVTLDRLTLASGRVDEHSVAELKKVSFRNCSDRIQTLSELLKQVDGQVPLLIELKTDWTSHGPAEQRIADILDGYKGHAAVMSFDPISIAVFSQCAPDLTRGLVAEAFQGEDDKKRFSPWRRFYMRHLLSAFSCKPHFINHDVRALPSLAPWFWRKILKRPLLAWTVRSAEQQSHALEWADAVVFEQYQPRL